MCAVTVRPIIVFVLIIIVAHAHQAYRFKSIQSCHYQNNPVFQKSGQADCQKVYFFHPAGDPPTPPAPASTTCNPQRVEHLNLSDKQCAFGTSLPSGRNEKVETNNTRLRTWMSRMSTGAVKVRSLRLVVGDKVAGTRLWGRWTASSRME